MEDTKQLSDFLANKSDYSLMLYNHFLVEFKKIGSIKAEATQTMIGISNSRKRIVWITQLGKNFIHVVLPFKRAYLNNLCFKKVVQVPGQQQFNHHLRILNIEDINEEVLEFMRLAYTEEN